MHTNKCELWSNLINITILPVGTSELDRSAAHVFTVHFLKMDGQALDSCTRHPPPLDAPRIFEYSDISTAKIPFNYLFAKFYVNICLFCIVKRWPTTKKAVFVQGTHTNIRIFSLKIMYNLLWH